MLGNMFDVENREFNLHFREKILLGSDSGRFFPFFLIFSDKFVTSDGRRGEED